MNIDTIMNPRGATTAEVARAFSIAAAVAEAIREAREIPSGTLYAVYIAKVERRIA